MNTYERADCKPIITQKKKDIIKQVLISNQEEKLSKSFDLSLNQLYALSTAIHIFWKYLEENGLQALADSERVDVSLAVDCMPDIEDLLSSCLDFDSLEELCCKTFSLIQRIEKL